jgi:hypothetical protein
VRFFYPASLRIEPRVVERACQLLHLLLERRHFLLRALCTRPRVTKLPARIRRVGRVAASRALLLLYAPECLVFRGAYRRCVLPLRARHLPFGKGAVEGGDVPVVQHPHAVRQHAQHRAVVAHEDHRPLVPFDRVFENFDRLDVQVVRWLIEHEQVGAREHEHRQCDPCAFAARERRRASLHFIAGESEPAKVPLNEPPLPLRAQIVDHVVQRFVERYLRQLLVVVRHPNRIADAQLAIVRYSLADECLEQRGFSRAIRAHDA